MGEHEKKNESSYPILASLSSTRSSLAKLQILRQEAPAEAEASATACAHTLRLAFTSSTSLPEKTRQWTVSEKAEKMDQTLVVSLNEMRGGGLNSPGLEMETGETGEKAPEGISTVQSQGSSSPKSRQAFTSSMSM